MSVITMIISDPCRNAYPSYTECMFRLPFCSCPGSWLLESKRWHAQTIPSFLKHFATFWRKTSSFSISTKRSFDISSIAFIHASRFSGAMLPFSSLYVEGWTKFCEDITLLFVIKGRENRHETSPAGIVLIPQSSFSRQTAQLDYRQLCVSNCHIPIWHHK